tara:strand:+ start:5322 stop:14024 length:8703 start_codon:yes stop_codon:yes gene_type:complete
MTDEEFLMSLPQDLLRDEKIRRLEEYRQENPQPEVEEETVEEETVEEPTEEPNVDLLNYQFQRTDLVPSLFGEPAGTPPQSTIQYDSDGAISINSNNIFNTDYSNLTLSDINTMIQPQQQNQEYLEAIEKLSVIAKPEEVIKERGYEYKYEITDDGKLMYYTRKEGSEDFTPIQSGDKYYEEIGGRVFKHFDFPEDQYNQANKTLKVAKNLSTSMYNQLESYANDITGATETEVPEEFIEIAEQFENEVAINEDDRRQINEDAMSFVLNNSKIDETKQGVNVLAKGGSSGVYEYKTGKKIDNPQWTELNEAAISQYAKENKIHADDVDLSDPQVEKEIFDIMAANKAIELTDKRQKRKMTDFIESQPSGFSWNKFGTWLYSELAMPGDLLDAEDVWSVNDVQKNMEALQKWKQTNVSQQSKDIGSFIKKSENYLILLQDTAEKIQNGKYTTSAQLAAANKELKNINQLRNQTFDLMRTKYDELAVNMEKSKDIAADINLLERNFNIIPLITNNIENSTIDALQGIEEIVFQAVNLPNNLSPDAKQAFQLFNPAWSIMNNLGIIGNWGDYRKDYNKRIDAYQQGMMSGIAEMGSLDDIENMDDFGRYYASMLGSVLPQAAVMIGTGGYGLGAVVLSSGGSKWKEMDAEMKASQDAHKLWEQRKPKKGKLESEEDYKKRVAAWNDTEPAVIDYNMVQMWGGALTNMAIEGTAGYFISLPLSQGKSFMKPLLDRVKAFNSPAVKNGFTKQFTNILKPTGDILIEGGEEGLVGIGNNVYDRIFLGKDVNIFEGFKDNVAGGIIGGKIFQAPGLLKPYLNMSQTPGDVSNITGYQNQIKSIANSITQNPMMSANTKNILNDKIADLTLNINNSVVNSLNRYTQMPVETISQLGNIEQSMFRVDQQIEQVQNDEGIQVGKDQLLEDLNNQKNNLTGEKNRILEPYVDVDAEGQVVGGGNLIAPISKKIDTGAEVIADQLGVGIESVDNTADFIGSVETIEQSGGQVINLERDANGDILPAEDQAYGFITRIPNDDGTFETQIIINNASNEADGVVTTKQHEVLHAALMKVDPEVKSKMGRDLLNYLESSNVEMSDRLKSRIEQYQNDPNVDESTLMEEIMTLTSEGLTNGDITINQPTGLQNIIQKVLRTFGINKSFSEGEGVLNFIKDFNADILKGEGLTQQTQDQVDMGLETEVDLGVVQSRKLPEATEVYMDVDNNTLQQGLNNAIQNQTDQQFPIAQAIVEKNWPLISKSLNINNEAEMNAAKEVVIDQVLGQFEGSGQGKYGPRNTSALSGFSLEGGAQVSTYLAETIRTRKPEIDAAIVDRTGGPGIQADQVGDVAVETEVAEVATTRRTPSQTTTYSDALLTNANTDKAGLETNITEAITTAYDGRTDVTLAETRNIPQEVAEVYATTFGLNPETIVDKRRNFSKKDADGLNAAKRFLLSNAQADFNRLPETVDASGKGTFIPKNVRDALYTDGKLTGTLSDYQDLIRTQPEKPIYRDRVGQTIRGLLNTHIRNRILETANPDSASRIASGAKFSAKPKTKTKPKEAKKPKVVTVKEIQSLERKGAESLQPEVKKGTIVISEKEGRKTSRSYIPKLDEVFNKDTGETVEQARNRVANNFLDRFPKWKNLLGKSMQGGLTGGLFLTKPVYNDATKNVPKARQVDVSQVAINKTGSKLNPKSLENIGTKEFKDEQLENIDTYVDYWKDVSEYLQDNKKDSWFFGVQAIDSQSITAGPFRKAAIYGFYNINNQTGKPDFKTKIKVEHSKPNSSTTDPFYEASQKGPEYVEALRPIIKASYMQGAVKDDGIYSDDTKLDNAGFKSVMPEVYYTDIIPAILDGKLDYLIDKYPGIVSVVRMAEAGINLNDYKSTFDGKTIPEIFGVEVDPQFRNDPNVIKAQNTAIVNTLKVDQKTAKTDVIKPFKEYIENIAESKTNATDKSLVDSGPEVFNPERTAEEMKTTAINSLQTRVLASKKTPKPKGISIFDFDDTLANTKEKVIVKMPDGKTKEISASEFAREAGNLTEAGATFDFSNFENVAKDTAEGPLADLARKRQGKFGSGDIFVLTARPNSAGPAIQQFLKSIGIDIPLSNITGLADGSPQAKVDFVLNKTAEGYNDFYFADDSFANVKAVSEILDAIDVKNTVEQAQSKEVRLNNEFNKQIEEVTGKESFKKYSDTRARLEGKKKDGGWIKRFVRQFTITPSADDFMGLLYAMAGKGEQGNKHLKFLKDNLIDPYNKAELELLTAKVNVGRDFAALRSKFPSLKGSTLSLTNPLLKEIDGGPFNKEQAVRVYLWSKQGIEIPGMSKRDVNALVKAVEADNELQTFANELESMQRTPQYPPPGKNWLGGSIKSDILESMDKSFRADLMSEFNENVDIIFSPENLNKIEAIYGSKYRQALEDSIRRMKSGNNRPKITGSGSGLVNEMLDWLNASVANVMFLNMRSGLLQTLSTVNFINWGDNNIVNASKAFASKEMWPTFMKLMNSDYLVNRRDGLKINVNEAELADAAKKGGIKGAFSYILDKGFAITRVMDSFAIALGGSTFFINRKKALLNRVNEKTGKLYTEAEADQKAFEDFYEVAEETQQSSNPSKISSQQASIAGRLLLSFQNVTMQFNRKTKKSIQDLYNRRKKPGMTQRESDMSNLSSVVYYVGMQNLMFNALQQGIFALMFDDEEEEEQNLTKQERFANVLNGMADSLLFGLGFGGAIVSTTKNILMRIADETTKKKPDYRDIPDDVFDVSSVVDAKFRKLKSAAKTFTFNRKEIRERGWSIDNPAYLAIAQIISAGFNVPVDRVLQKVNNLRQASDESVRTWQRVALVMGWNGWNFGLPYWGRQSTIDKENKNAEKVKENYEKQVKEIKSKGFTKKIPLSGPNHYKPKGKLGVDYVQVERPSGEIQYYIKP